MPAQQQLNIAAFHISLRSERDIFLDHGYIPFVCNPSDEADIRIKCLPMVETAPPFDTSTLLFEAASEQQLFYRIFRHHEELGFVIYNQQTNEVQQYALLNRHMTDWTIWSKPMENESLEPLRYPMGPILMHYMTLKYNAVMMHASCAFDGEKGRLFSGFSGAGKSTMSRIWHENGATIINDDRLIIRTGDDGKLWVHNTPMYYADAPKKAPLSAIYLIRHSPENRAERLRGAVAVSRVMAFSIQNNFDKTFIRQRLDLFSRICSEVPVNELGFLPNKEVIAYIRDYEQTCTR